MNAKLPQRQILELPTARQKRQRLHLTPREQEVLYLMVNGNSPREISDQLQISTSEVSRILRGPAVEHALKEYDELFRLELRGMQGAICRGIKKLVGSPDPDVMAKGINMWNRMHNMYEQTINVNLSAEDIIEQILRRRRGD